MELLSSHIRRALAEQNVSARKGRARRAPRTPRRFRPTVIQLRVAQRRRAAPSGCP